MFLSSRDDDGGDTRAALQLFGLDTVVSHQECGAGSRGVSVLIADLAPAKGGA